MEYQPKFPLVAKIQAWQKFFVKIEAKVLEINGFSRYFFTFDNFVGLNF